MGVSLMCRNKFRFSSLITCAVTLSARTLRLQDNRGLLLLRRDNKSPLVIGSCLWNITNNSVILEKETMLRPENNTIIN